MEKTTMSVAELSMQMGISLPKAYELVKQPGFPTIRVGTREGDPDGIKSRWGEEEPRHEVKAHLPDAPTEYSA